MHQRQPRMQYPIAISRPKKMIQIRLTRKEKPPPPYTTSFPNGKKARLANLKHCRPTGMPMMVMHQRQPASTQASPPINPPNRNQRIFPIVDIVVTSISRYFAPIASCRSIHAISSRTMRFCSSSVSSRPILVQHRMLLGLWSQPVLRKRIWMRNISGSARAMTRPLMNGQWIATIGDGSCVRFAAELSRMRRCPITVAREVQTGESVPIVHEMVVANPHIWLDIIRMMVYY